MEAELYAPIVKLHFNKVSSQFKPPEHKNHVIINEASNEILHFCSSEYKLKLNKNIFKPLEELLQKNKIKFNRVIHIVSKTKFYVDYILNFKKIKIGVLPQFTPCISAWNSYDGSLKSQIVFSYFRKDTQKKISSIEVLPLDCDIEICEKTIKQFANKDRKDFYHYNKLNNVNSGPETIEKICKKLKLSPEIRKYSIVNFEEEIRKYKNKTTLFTSYLAINKAIYECNTKEVPEFKLKRDKAVLNELLKLINNL